MPIELSTATPSPCPRSAPRMRRIAASLSLTLAAALALAPGATAAGRLVVKGHGYRPRHRDEPVRRARLRPARQLLPRDPRPLLRADRRRAADRPAGRAGAAADDAARRAQRRRRGGLAQAQRRVDLLGRRERRARLALRRVGPAAGHLRRAAAAGRGRGRRVHARAAPRPTGRATVATAARWSSRAVGGRLQAINALSLEDYVRGVDLGRVAVDLAGRGAQGPGRRGAHLCGDDQRRHDHRRHRPVRRHALADVQGRPAEYPTTDAAVAATAGQVVAQNGKPVTTYFFSTSGGHTENVEDSFIGALPRTWLKGVDDPFDAVSPRHNWGPFTFSQATVQAKLKGLVRGSFRGITVLERGASPRIVRAEVNGTNGVTQVTGPQLRARLGLFDTWASFTYISGSRSSRRMTMGAAARRPSSPRPPRPPARRFRARRSRPRAAAPRHRRRLTGRAARPHRRKRPGKMRVAVSWHRQLRATRISPAAVTHIR